MSEDDPQGRGDEPSDVPIRKERKSFWDSAYLIWAIPVIALAIALGAAWHSYSDRGPVIEVSFSEAAGIQADKTQLRYRDIPVGTVQDVRFSSDLQRVVVAIRVDKDLAPYIDSDARFWVVRPQVSARGVSGLDTVLSGVYIQGTWDNSAGGMKTAFKGLDHPPLLTTGQKGIKFKLKSTSGLPAAGTPILYKNVDVGAIGDSTVAKDGSSVTADAVIYEPHTNYVTTSTRFWDISGFSFSLGAGGAKLNFNSLASLVSGGVTFDTLGSGGTPLKEGAVYTLFPSEDAARQDFLVEGENQVVNVAMVFDQNISGLSAGAGVELGGLRVGEVTSINGLVDQKRFGNNHVHLIASVKMNPSRLGLSQGTGRDAFLDYLQERVKSGLRARLVNASLFTGGLKIELVEIPNAAPATLDRNAEPLPTIPTAPAKVSDVGATAQGVLQRVNDLPIEELMHSVIGFLDNAKAFIGNKDLQQAPAQLTGLLAAVRTVAESDGVQKLPEQVNGLLSELRRTSATLNQVVAQLQQEKTVGKLTRTIENANAATEKLPDLIADLRGVLAKARAVPLGDISQNVNDLLAAGQALLNQTDTLVASDDVKAVPQELRRILTSVRTVTENQDVQQLPDKANALIARLQNTADTIDRLATDLEQRDVVGKVTSAVNNVADAANGLPQLVDEARGIVKNAGNVPLDKLTQQASGLLASANRVLDQDSTRQLPDELNKSLTSLREILAQLQKGGLVENANRTLASARDAADQIAKVSSTLPELADSLRAVAKQAGNTLSAYSGDSPFTRDTRAAIRQIQDAAKAVERLARTIERKPNSLILGR
ncbi:MlaD family protein [Pararhizobium mangrovi]|uniref:MCE family protein n=1 Tax=Pararhizobium mangrovi TaxID=2590452 RepID=A0A506UAZ4_9HYPH|nr:MlaD family protein [Pararhizobium mangrovi]TPW28977.1 MCE family protein [Pararhizobium mangrovi]